MNLYLCAFSDEASDDFETQIKILKREKIPYMEIRGVNGKNISEITESEAKHCKKMLDENGIKVWSVGSPIGKISISDDFAEHLRMSEHVFRITRILDAENVRIFSFYTDNYEAAAEEVVRRLNILSELAEKHSLKLCHENEKEIFGDSADRCLYLLNRVKGLLCVFDPANFIQCGENIEYAYKTLKNRVYYYHIKDALKKDGTIVPAGDGDGLIDRIVREIDGDKVLTLEPHLTEFGGYAKIDRTKLKNNMMFDTPVDAFCYGVKALEKLLEKNGYTEINNIRQKERRNI